MNYTNEQAEKTFEILKDCVKQVLEVVPKDDQPGLYDGTELFLDTLKMGSVEQIANYWVTFVNGLAHYISDDMMEKIEWAGKVIDIVVDCTNKSMDILGCPEDKIQR